MTLQIDIVASAKEFASYKSLVESDWNKTALNRVLELMWHVIAIPKDQRVKHHEWLAFLAKKDQQELQNGAANQVLEHLTLLSAAYREPGIPRLPASLASGSNKAAAQMVATVKFLLLQVFVDLRGQTGFFQDLQSLLFFNAVHYLLPHLKKAGLSKEHDALVNALHIHAFVIWRAEPSHMFYLLGAMMGHLGIKRARLGYLDRSQAATPVDDHSFLTRANAYWAELLELGEKDKAMDYLLRISRISPLSYVEEIEEMIKETAASQVGSHA